MARFRGVVAGARGEASRLGHKNTGLTVRANGWSFGVRVDMTVNAAGEDEATVTLTSGSNGCGLSKHVGTFTAKDLPEVRA